MAIFRYLRHNENFANTFTLPGGTGLRTKYPKYPVIQPSDK